MTRLAIAALVFMMIQAVFFGIAAATILSTPLTSEAATLMPWAVVVTSAISLPVSWWLAPRLRARFWRHHPEGKTAADRALVALS